MWKFSRWMLLLIAITFAFLEERNAMNDITEGTIRTADGIQLYFQKVGSGPKVLIIPNGMYLLEDFRRFAKDRTTIFYDVRNRGRSEPVLDAKKLAKGILQDVQDLDVVRKHFGVDSIDLIGHSYMGLMVALYAIKYPDHANRIVQLAPMQLDITKQYPAHLTGADATAKEVFSRIAELQKETRSDDPEEACRKFWSVLREIYVTDRRDAEKIDWGRCDLPNERNFMKYWNESIFPSIQNLKIEKSLFAEQRLPVLIVHGTRDRSAPYGGARDWAMIWPNARLLIVENGGHAPWIEAPQRVFLAIETFLNGAWPNNAVTVTSPEM